MVVFVLILAVLGLLYLLALFGGRRHELWKKLEGWSYAHRGFHGNGVPENSMAAFRLALEKGYGIELDLHLMADGGLAVIHDASLKRTAGADVLIEDLTAADLNRFRLEGTEETIPQFGQVLELFAGKAPMIVELKAEGGNHAALCQAACELLAGYEGPYCIESFDPRCILWLRKNRPEVIRGQLAQNFLRSKGGNLSGALRFALTNLLLNFLTRPDFIAYNFWDRKGLSPILCHKFWGIHAVSWTLRTRADYDAAAAEGRIPIFENFEP